MRWLRRVTLALGLASASTLAMADVVTECGDWTGPEHLVEPWDKTSRIFSRGTARVAVVDLGEPDCCPRHIIVLIPANMYGGRSCFLIARNALLPNGWAKVGIDEAESLRDDVPGLRISVPVYSYDYRTGGADPASRRVIHFRVRQAAGTVELEQAQ